MYSSRIGKKKVTIVQANGSTLDLILCDFIYVPDICINLFSTTKELNKCWTQSNHGLLMVRNQADLKITFDQTLKTTHGYVCGVTMLPSYASKGVVIDIIAPEHCCSPFGGDPLFYDTPDKPFRTSDILSARSAFYYSPDKPFRSSDILSHNPEFISQNQIFIYQIVIQMSNNTLPHIT
jgi:hypothetical protein